MELALLYGPVRDPARPRARRQHRWESRRLRLVEVEPGPEVPGDFLARTREGLHVRRIPLRRHGSGACADGVHPPAAKWGMETTLLSPGSTPSTGCDQLAGTRYGRPWPC